MDKRKIALLLGLVAIGAVVAQRARAARAPRAASSRDPDLPSLLPADADEVRIEARPFTVPSIFVPPPAPSLFDELGDDLGAVVDQVKDALKGLGLWSRKVPPQYAELFAMTGAQYRLPPGLLEAVAYRESRFRQDIISGQFRSSAGAVGIMQIVPKWHPELGEAGALDPLRAVPYAARYLRELFVEFGSWRQALAAYNWGPANQKRDLQDRIVGNQWPKETREYVAEITANAGLA